MSLLDLPVRRPTAVAMAFLAVVVLGLVAWQRVPVELFPEVEGDTIYVIFGRANAEPEVVEREMLLPLHARASALPMVAESGGTVRGSGGSYWVRFEAGGDIRVRELELRRIAADIQRSQPRNTASVDVSSTQSNTAAYGSYVMRVHVLGDADRNTLRDLADELLEPRFASVPGVSQVMVSGGARRQLTVRVDLGRVTAVGATPEQVAGAVNRHVRQISHVGDLESEGGRMDVFVDGRLPGLHALREASIVPGGAAKIRHVADVEFGFAPNQSEFRVNGEPAVGIDIFQEQGANLIRLGRELRARVAELREEVAPLGLDLVIGNDAAEQVEEQVGHLARLGASGYLIALAVLFLFLRQWRAVAVVGIAVPVSLLAAVALLHLFGQSLNLVSLVGLSVAVGLLIDNSVVVYEAVLRRLERGVAPDEAIRIGLRRTVRAIAAASLTTAIVFLPAALVDMNVMYRTLVEIFALSVLLPLAASLLVAVGLVPVLAYRLAAPAAIRQVARQSERRRLAGGLVAPDPARILFGGVVASALRRPSAWVAGILFAVMATFPVLLAFVASGGTQDAERADEVQLSVRFAKGQSSVAALTDAVAGVERALLAIPGVETVTSSVDEEGASITVGFVDLDERPADLTVSRVRKLAEQTAKAVPGFEVLRPDDVQRERSGGGGGGDGMAGLQSAPREVRLSGPESAALDRLARDVVARLEAVPAVASARQSTWRGREEVWVEPNRRAFEAFGLTVGEVMPMLELAGRDGLKGGGSFVLPSGREIPVVVERQGARDERGLRDLRDLRIHTESGVAPVTALASVRQMPPPPVISHRNGRRETRVVFRLGDEQPDSGPALIEIEREIAAVVQSVPREPGYVVEIVKEEEDANLLRNVALPAVLLVLLVLAMAFESLTLPVLVVLSWPLALLGAVWVLLLTGTPPSMMVGVGAIALFGIAINPAILLVDRMQQRIRGGWSAGAAAFAAVRERTRPVLMTSATTIAALWPLALTTGRENEMWPPFATVIIGGIATATVLTLLVIPVGFILLRRLDRLFGRVGPWLVVGWLAATLGTVLSLTLTGVVESMLWQIVTSLLIGSGLLAVTVLLFRRPALVEPRTDAGPPELDVRNLRKVYGLPGPLRQAIRAPDEFAARVRRTHSAAASGERSEPSGGGFWQDAVSRLGPAALLVAAPLALSTYVQGGGWKLILWLLGAAFAGRLLAEIRAARRRPDSAGASTPGRVESAVRVALPWLAIAVFAYWMLLAPYLAGEPAPVSFIWPALAAPLLALGQLARRSAVRQRQGLLPARIASGPLRYPRTLLRRWALRLGGFDLPVQPVQALTAVNFRVTQGMVGILGPNGAGKTTLLRQLAGILDPTRGAIFLGEAPLAGVQRVLARWVGYLPQDAGLPGGLSPREYLAYYAALYDLPVDVRRERVDSLLTEVGLAEKADDKIKALSGGMRQRVAVARTLLRLPPVIIVDEPTVGLDPRERIRFRNLLARLARERIVLFSTHVVEDVAVACERVLVLASGRLVFDGPPAALADAAHGKVWEMRSGAEDEAALPAGAILAEEAPVAGGVLRRVLSDGAPAANASPVDARLEDGYLWLISTPPADEAAA